MSNSTTFVILHSKIPDLRSVFSRRFFEASYHRLRRECTSQQTADTIEIEMCSNYRSERTDSSNQESPLALKEVSLSGTCSTVVCEVARRCIPPVSQLLRSPEICTTLPVALDGRCHLPGESIRLIRGFSVHGHLLGLLECLLVCLLVDRFWDRFSDRLWVPSRHLW